jgi:hypothetical protein
MKYALLGYASEGSLDALAPGEKRSLHRQHRSMHDEAVATGNPSVNVIAHYRLRPPHLATTIRVAGRELVTTQGPEANATGVLRALYLLEADGPDAVLDFASRLPALRIGGHVEIWPLTEPNPQHGRPGHGHRAT